MKKTIIVTLALTVAILGVLLALALIPAPRHAPSVDACKAAMRDQFELTLANGGTDTGLANRPAACSGVDDATVARLAEEILTEESGG